MSPNPEDIKYGKMRMNRYLSILIVVILATGLFGLSCSGSSDSSTSSSLSQATSGLVSIKFGNVTSVNLDTGVIMFNVSFSPNKSTVLGDDYYVTFCATEAGNYAPQQLSSYNLNFKNNNSVSNVGAIYTWSLQNLVAAQSAYSLAASNMRAMYYIYIPPVSEVSDADLADYLSAQWKKSPNEPFLKEAGNPDISYKQELDNLVKLDTELKDAESTTNQLVGKPLPSSIYSQLEITITDTTK
jgi:hypothetical protein